MNPALRYRRQKFATILALIYSARRPVSALVGYENISQEAATLRAVSALPQFTVPNWTAGLLNQEQKKKKKREMSTFHILMKKHS